MLGYRKCNTRKLGNGKWEIGNGAIAKEFKIMATNNKQQTIND
jgi:hypothetical protein